MSKTTQNARRFTLKTLSAAAMVATLGGLSALPAHAQSTIKVGVLHSLSGTMAISETVLKDTVLMAIDEINASGGVLGKQLEAVVVDPGLQLAAVRRKGASGLLSQDKVSPSMFGCWTSVSRKSVLPVVQGGSTACCSIPCSTKAKNSSKNVFYTGAAPNQQAIPGGRIPDVQGRRRRPSAGSCSAPTTSIRAPPTRSCARS